MEKLPSRKALALATAKHAAATLVEPRQFVGHI